MGSDWNLTVRTAIQVRPHVAFGEQATADLNAGIQFPLDFLDGVHQRLQTGQSEQFWVNRDDYLVSSR